MDSSGPLPHSEKEVETVTDRPTCPPDPEVCPHISRAPNEQE